MPVGHEGRTLSRSSSKGKRRPFVVYHPLDLSNRERNEPTLPECCRVPAAHDRSTAPASRRARWSTTAAVVPGILAALLPRITCPACWPAYAGFLGAAGLPILMDVRWLLPLTGTSLVVAVGALAVGARRRRGYAPLVVGLAASGLVLIGKFVMSSNPATYLGTALLVCASVWNAWPASGSIQASMRGPTSQVTRWK